MNQPAWVPEFQAFNREVMAESETPGLAVAVALDGETVYEDGYGLRDRERGLPVTPETIFGIGSLTKSFTTLSIMQLADAGNLSVNDPVVKFLPEFRVPRPKSEAPITLHHLMSHCSGLPEEPLLVHARGPSMRRDPDIKKIRGQQLPSAFFTPEYAAKDITNYNGLLALLAEASFEMLGPPENHHSYSDESFALLQGVVERVSGKPMVSYLRENIWQPLGWSTREPRRRWSRNTRTPPASSRAGTPACSSHQPGTTSARSSATAAWHPIPATFCATSRSTGI